MTDKLREAAQHAERVAFEAKWATPTNCTWTGNGYCSTEYHAWSAESHALRWEGWKARAELAQQGAQAVPLPEHETEAMHDAVMAVMYKGVTRTNTNALWKAYRCAILNSAPTPPAQQDAQAVPQGEAIVEEFSAWLNERRGMTVALVFHEVVAKFRAAVEQQELSEAFRTELDKVSQRNFELRMENASLKAAPTPPAQ